MRVMGIEALVPRPAPAKPHPGHKIYRYLLRGLKIVEPNHVWAADDLHPDGVRLPLIWWRSSAGPAAIFGALTRR
jgi:hypothetical protein